MKFACFGEICAPPIRWPLRPHASSIRPALSSCSGFLKTLPKVRLFVGCAALRRAFSSRTSRLDLLGVARPQPQLRRERRPGRGARFECRYESPSSAGVSQPLPSAVATSARSSTCEKSLPYAPRVHPDAAADRAGDRARELEAAEPGSPRPVEARPRSPRRRPHAGASPSTSTVGELAAELEDERVDAVVRDEQVRAEPDRRRPRGLVSRGPAQELLDLATVSGRANARAGPPVPSVV